MPSGKIEGRRAELIDYTRKKIIPEEELNNKIQHEIESMRINDGKKWTTYPMGYNRNRIFENDSLIIFKQIGIAVSERLQKEHNLTIVKDLLMWKEKNDTKLKL